MSIILLRVTKENGRPGAVSDCLVWKGFVVMLWPNSYALKTDP